jgi:hypothetical protein
MSNFEKVIKVFNKLSNERPDPEDHLFNIKECCQHATMNDEEWMNFYTYITDQNQDEFEYRKITDVETLGDLGEEELTRIAKTLEYSDEFVVESHTNGDEINIFVKRSLITSKNNNHAEPMDGALEEISSSPQGNITERSNVCSIENVFQDGSVSPCEEKETEEKIR